MEQKTKEALAKLFEEWQLTENVRNDFLEAVAKVVDDNGGSEMLTQSQVNEIVQNRLKETEARLLKSYGVSDRASLDALVKKGQDYDAYKTNAETRLSELASLKENNLFLKRGIDDKRYDDIRFIMKGKGIEINDESLEREIATHPEWIRQTQTKQETTPIQQPSGSTPIVGSTEGNPPPSANEKEEAEELFGMKFLNY